MSVASSYCSVTPFCRYRIDLRCTPPSCFSSLAILYKPSTQRTLAALYATGDARIEGAQVLIHLTANIGAAGGSLLAGIITIHAGWSVTYACAALIMSVACALLWPAKQLVQLTNRRW